MHINNILDYSEIIFINSLQSVLLTVQNMATLLTILLSGAGVAHERYGDYLPLWRDKCRDILKLCQAPGDVDTMEKKRI